MARFYSRRVLPFRERKRRKALISAFAEVLKVASKHRHYGFEAQAAISNVALFFLIAERDIQAVKIDALTHPDPWQRSLCARIILLTIHELDLDKVTGQRLKKALETVQAPKEIKMRAVDALRRVRKVHERAEREFAFVRNAAIAHRDPDAVAQYRAIAQVDEIAVMQLAGEFYEASHAFIGLLPALIAEVGGMRGLMRQLLAGGTVFNCRPGIK